MLLCDLNRYQEAIIIFEKILELDLEDSDTITEIKIIKKIVNEQKSQ